MDEMIDFLVIFLIVLNFRLLSSSRLATCIKITAIQAFLLSVIAIIIRRYELDLRFLSLLFVNVAIKSVFLPMLLGRVTREARVNRELDPIVGYIASLVIGLFLLGICFVFARTLNLQPHISGSLFVPVAFFTIFCGLFIIIARKKAATQVVGYMVMENGIYAFGISMAVIEPFIVELGVLLDIFVVILIMGIAIFHINREFSHIDTNKLTNLRD